MHRALSKLVSLVDRHYNNSLEIGFVHDWADASCNVLSYRAPGV